MKSKSNRTFITTKTITTLLSFFLLIAPFFVSAAVSSAQSITNPLKFTSISLFINDLLGYVVKVGSVVATFAFIWSGFLYVKARGNETDLTAAKAIFINTCYGTALLLGAKLLSTIIKSTVDSLQK